MKRRYQSSTMSDEPLVVMELGCSYLELFWMLERFPVPSSILSLPPEILHKIAHFFTVKPVVSSDVQVTRASSSSEQHPLQAALDDGTSTWWISAPGSMTRGRGREFVEFQLADRRCRLTEFSIQIPPLPMGPLSVRRFQLMARSQRNPLEWYNISPIWTVENRTGWQEYKLEKAVDAQHVRVICLTNQMAMMFDQITDEEFIQIEAEADMYSCVGFYCVKFS